jgi:uncharacterized protein (DUF2141 family)
MNRPRRFRAAVIAVFTAFAATFAAAPAMAAGEGAPAGCQGPASDTWINIVVDGVRNGNGLMAVSLYADDASKFLVRKGSLYTTRVDATAGTTRVCVFLPRPGVYAFAVYHDENASRKLDRTGLGLPAEGFGFSNNPSTLAGIPSFRSVRLNVARSGLGARVHLRYP